MGYDYSKPCDAYDKMREDLDLIAALMGGTNAMREARQRYLPQEPREEPSQYQNRLRRTFLFNGFENTVKDLVARPFSKEVTLTKASNERLKEISENVDLAGSNLHEFAKDLFSAAIQDGKAHVLVDFPPAVPDLRLADERAMGRRPFWVLIRSKDFIYWESRKINGKTTLTLARIRECETVRSADGGQKELERVREFKVTGIADDGKLSVQWTLFAKNPNPKAGETEWVVIDSGPVTVGRIPIVTFYADRTGFMTARPPLKTLAELNLQHWQESSDQNNILHVARVPILFGAGITKEDVPEMVVGASKMIRAAAVDAKLSFVEHSGAAIGAGRQSLADLEDKIRVTGVDMLTRKAGDETATAKALDSSGKMLILQAMAKGCEFALEDCMALTALWLDLQEAVADVVVNTDFGLSLRDAESVTAIKDLWLNNKFSDRLALSELQRHGTIADHWTVEGEQEAKEEQGPPLGLIPADPLPAAGA